MEQMPSGRSSLPDKEKVIRQETYKKYTKTLTNPPNLSPRKKHAEKSELSPRRKSAKEDEEPVIWKPGVDPRGPKHVSKTSQEGKSAPQQNKQSSPLTHQKSPKTHQPQNIEAKCKVIASEEATIGNTNKNRRASGDTSSKKNTNTQKESPSSDAHGSRESVPSVPKCGTNSESYHTEGATSIPRDNSSKIPTYKTKTRHEEVTEVSQVFEKLKNNDQKQTNVDSSPKSVLKQEECLLVDGGVSHVRPEPSVKKVSFTDTEDVSPSTAKSRPKKQRAKSVGPLKLTRQASLKDKGSQNQNNRIPVRVRKMQRMLLSPDRISPITDRSTRIPKPLIEAGVRRSYVSYVRACRRRREQALDDRRTKDNPHITTSDDEEFTHMADIQRKYRAVLVSELRPWKKTKDRIPKKSGTDQPSTSASTSYPEARRTPRNATGTEPHTKVTPRKVVQKPRSARTPVISREFFSDSLKKSLASHRSVASQIGNHDESEVRADSVDPYIFGDSLRVPSLLGEVGRPLDPVCSGERIDARAHSAEPGPSYATTSDKQRTSDETPGRSPITPGGDIDGDTSLGRKPGTSTPMNDSGDTSENYLGSSTSSRTEIDGNPQAFPKRLFTTTPDESDFESCRSVQRSPSGSDHPSLSLSDHLKRKISGSIGRDIIIDIDDTTKLTAPYSDVDKYIVPPIAGKITSPVSNVSSPSGLSGKDVDEDQYFETSASMVLGDMTEDELGTSTDRDFVYNLPGTPLPKPVVYSITESTQTPIVRQATFTACQGGAEGHKATTDGQAATTSAGRRSTNLVKPPFRSAREATWCYLNGISHSRRLARRQSKVFTPWGDGAADNEEIEDIHTSRRRKYACCSRLKQWYKEFMKQGEPWLFRKHIKQVEGQFGCGIASFFVFLRLVITMNFFLCILWLGFVVVPQAIYFDYDFMSEIFYLRNLLDGGNALSKSWMFYGNYSQFAGPYPLAIMYLFAILLTYFGGVFYLFSCMAQSIHDQGQVVPDKRYTFSHIVFTGWDYSFSSKEASVNLGSTNAQSLRDHMSVIAESKQLDSQSRKEKYQTTARRVLAWFLTSILVGGGCAAIFYLIGADFVSLFGSLGYHVDDDSPLVTYGSTFIFIFINGIIPFCVFKLTKLERYVRGKTEINVSICRVFVLRIANVAALVTTLYNKVRKGGHSQCAGTLIGQEIYKLVFLDALVQLFVQLVPTFLRYYWTRKKVEFKMPTNILKVVYKQALIWVGAMVCPVLPLAGFVSMTVFFLTNYLVVTRICRPPVKRFNQSRRSTFFLGLLSATLLILLVPVAIVIGSNEVINIGETGQEGVYCGPYGNSTMIELITNLHSAVGSESHTFEIALDHLFSPTVLLPLIFILSAWLYFQQLRIKWEIGRRILIEHDLDKEREESKYLRKKLHLMTDSI